jgi:hypothetical protein
MISLIMIGIVPVCDSDCNPRVSAVFFCFVGIHSDIISVMILIKTVPNTGIEERNRE